MGNVVPDRDPRGRILAAVVLLAVAPLAGGLLRGLPPEFLEIPPLTRYVDHAPFSRPVFGLFAVLGLLALALVLRPRWFGFRREEGNSSVETRSSALPVWFWIGLGLNILSWTCAWKRFDWLGPARDYTFFPLWLGYILVVDGIVYRRAGSSLLSARPREFAVLFPASALCWWYFEYLNRFVQNWWYEGAQRFSALHYASVATLCFSTVLPAIFETRDALQTFSWWQTAYRHGPAWKPWPRSAVHLAHLAGAAGLVLMAVFPNGLFFVTWLAPLALLAAALSLAGLDTPFADLQAGDYTRLFTLGAAALVCGFFWEMWNFWSLPKWHYTVPFVQRWMIFEMPVVGYTGYLPFGPECLCIWTALNALAAGRREPVSLP